MIAVIDNDPAFLHFMARLLGSEGYDVLPLSNAAEAVEAVQTKQPALVVLDLHMEEREGGLRLLRQLRQEAVTARIPVLFCTGDVAVLHKQAELLKTLDCEVLEKPFTADDLLRKVRRAMETASVEGAQG